MTTTDTTSPIYQNKPQRANSEDINIANEQQQNLTNSYALQRASSSDPKLPTQNNIRRDSISSEESDSISNATTPPRHLISNGSVSSSVMSTPTYLNEKTSRLQTIESGLSLADQQAASKSPKPPLHSPHRSSSNSSTLLPPIPNEEDDDKRSNSILPQITLQRQTSHQSQQSTTSYYSVDAGKHNFLSYNTPNPNLSGDNDSINTHVSNGSLVFKYQVGEETPPADYALPASILKVYGDDVSPNTNDEEVSKDVRGGVNHHNWHSGISSTIVYKPSFDEDTTDGDEEIDEELGTTLQNAGDNTEQGKKKSKNRPPRKSPPRLPHLPYHERKRLAELEEKEKQRRKSEAEEKEKKRKNNRKVSPKKTRIVKGASREYKIHTSEQTPLNDTKNGYGSSSNKNEDNEQQPGNPSWFGQLVNIVTGNRDSTDIDVEEEAKSYLNQGQAFLKKTEKERMKLKEQGRKEELAHVNIPVSNQSFGGHSRAITSMSQALDSIVSCSDEEHEDESSSDEESGSYFQEQQPITPPKQVWNYGEPPTATQTKYTPTPKKKNISSQRRKDSIMKRERLLQEEYEYRLRRLKNENEKLSRRFRIFVLVTVALIFCGALAFAFLVCIRMLMSL